MRSRDNSLADLHGQQRSAVNSKKKIYKSTTTRNSQERSNQ